MKKIPSRSTGFTIIELLIVVVVVGILSALVIVGYTGIVNRARVATVTADLRQTSSQLNNLRQVSGTGTYPDPLGENDISTSTDAEVFYTAYNDQDPTDFCFTEVLGDVVMHVTRDGVILDGYCEDHVPEGLPDAPAIATMSDSQSQITVTWEAVEVATSYRLEYATSSDFTGLTDIEAITGTSQAVTGLSAGTTYYFRLYAINGVGDSLPSETVEETTQSAAPAGAPTISATVNSPSQITVNWTTVAGAATYKLERSTSSSFTSPTMVTGLTGNSTAVSGLSAGIRYYFRAYAVNGSNVDSAASNVINATTTINAPDSPTVAASIPGSARSASSGPWAKSYDNLPTSGNWYYAVAAISSSTCASGTTREQRARIQYNSPTTWGAWTSWTTSTSFYAVGPSAGYGIRFQVQTHCKTSYYTSASSSYGYGCRWRSTNSTSCSGF